MHVRLQNVLVERISFRIDGIAVDGRQHLVSLGDDGTQGLTLGLWDTVVPIHPRLESGIR